MRPFQLRVLSALVLCAGAIPLASAQTGTFTSMSMASYGPLVSPDSIAAGFGSNLAASTIAASGIPLLTTLGNVQVNIVDSGGAKFTTSLYMVSPTQINYLVPAAAALGKATVTVTTSGNNTAQGSLLISNVSPAIATANNNGMGVPAAQVFRLNAAGATVIQSPFSMGSGTSGFVPLAINLSPSTDQVYLMLYGTGVRRHSLDPVKASIHGVNVPVTYAGAQSQYPGLDQINVGPLPQTLVGAGTVNLILTVDGVPANTVTLAFQ